MDEPWKTVYEAGIEERGNGFFIIKKHPDHPNQYPQKVWDALDELLNDWDCQLAYEDN